MIFRSRKRRAADNTEPADEEAAPEDAAPEDAAPEDAASEDAVPEDTDATEDRMGDSSGPGAGAVAGAPETNGNHPDVSASDVSGAVDAVDDLDDDGDLPAETMEHLDTLQWRDEGPYDIREVDADALDEESDEGGHIDLGSMVLPATEDTEFRLQIDEDSEQVVSVMMIQGESALEVGAFAAPSSGGLWAEIRDELVDSVTEHGGSTNFVSGPFGVELRRLIPVETPDGEQGYQPSRMWVAEGPRWMLRGIVYGEAALTDGTESPAAELLDMFCRIVVRRGDEPMAPGDLLSITLPEGMDDDQAEEGQSAGDESDGTG